MDVVCQTYAFFDFYTGNVEFGTLVIFRDKTEFYVGLDIAVFLEEHDTAAIQVPFGVNADSFEGVILN